MYTYRLQPTARLVAVPGWAPCMTEEVSPSACAPGLWCAHTMESKACHCLQPGCIRTGCNQRHTSGCASLASLHDSNTPPPISTSLGSGLIVRRLKRERWCSILCCCLLLVYIDVFLDGCRSPRNVCARRHCVLVLYRPRSWRNGGNLA